MARTPADATRFTSTGPYAASKPASSTGAGSFTANASPSATAAAASATSSQHRVHLGHGGPSNETPQQKIARLRAAAAAARAGKESNFDRVVRVGRRWADRAHRVTAYSLIGLTVVSGITASFAIGDMLMHNRRKRAEWLADQQRKHTQQIHEARAQLAAGQAITADQQLLLNQERAALEAEQARRNKKGLFTRAKETLFAAVPEEEVKGGKMGGAGASGGVLEAVEEVRSKARGEIEAAGRSVEQGVQRVQESWKAGEGVSGVVVPQGGPLDREAQAAEQAIKAKGKSWMDWVMRR